MIMTFDLGWFLSMLGSAFLIGFSLGAFIIAWAHAYDARRDKK